MASPSDIGNDFPLPGSELSSVLPKPVTPIRKVLDGEIDPKRLVTVVGLVTDFRPPIPTRGKDYKAEMKLFDTSIQDGYEDFIFTIFLPEDRIPQVEAGDVVCLENVRVQRYRSSDPLSGLSTRSTRIHIFKSLQIPKPPGDATCALVKRPDQASPSQEILRYVPALYQSIDKSRIPDSETFKVMAAGALNVKSKVQELGNVTEGNFYDLIVQVVREPYDSGDNVVLWVSDYTENRAFFLHADGSCADPMGYTTAPGQGWHGPLGKMSMQLTCWEPHAEAIRSEVSVGTSLQLQNVQVRYGRNGSNLEGFLRGDRRYPTRINVNVLEPQEDPDDVNPRLKELLRRKRDYERGRKRLLKAAASKESKKRKLRNDSRENAKTRRAKNRTHLQDDGPMLNSLVSCNNIDISSTSIASVLEPVFYNLTMDGVGGPMRVELPFTNAKYRVVVRVTDFFPATLEAFSHRRKDSEFDALSDNESEEDDDDDDDDNEGLSADGAPDHGGKGKWEWRFALQLEDASPRAGSKPPRLWVYVDNAEAQSLTGLDASNLRSDPQGMVNLRTQMAKLWGNLEERKRKLAEQKEAAKSRRRDDDIPAQDSDDEDDTAPGKKSDDKNGTENPSEVELRTKAFSCCVRQFGIKVSESDPEKATASNGQRWERRFGLFGTKIQYPNQEGISSQ